MWLSLQQRFVAVNPLVTAPQIPSHVPEADEKSAGFASRDMMLPDAGLVHCRLLVTAWENGLENIHDDTVTLLFKAIQVKWLNYKSNFCFNLLSSSLQDFLQNCTSFF